MIYPLLLTVAARLANKERISLSFFVKLISQISDNSAFIFIPKKLKLPDIPQSKFYLEHNHRSELIIDPNYIAFVFSILIFNPDSDLNSSKTKASSDPSKKICVSSAHWPNLISKPSIRNMR